MQLSIDGQYSKRCWHDRLALTRIQWLVLWEAVYIVIVILLSVNYCRNIDMKPVLSSQHHALKPQLLHLVIACTIHGMHVFWEC